MINESIKNTFNLTFDSRATERKTVNTGVEFQFDIRLSSSINSPEKSTAAHQTQAKAGYANNEKSMAFFDNVDVEQYFVEIDGIRHLKVSLDVEYARNNYRGEC